MDNEEVFNDLIVVKRSGQRVSFNGLKIAVAIKKAFDSTNSLDNKENLNKVYNKVLDYIKINYQGRKTINVEDIQDVIENVLKEEHYDVYTQFSDYRIKRSESRKVFSTKQQHKFVKTMEKIDLLDNTLYSPTKMLSCLSKTISLEYAKAYVLDSKYVRACEEGKIFIHNLPYFHLGVLLNTHIKLLNDNYEHFFDDVTKELVNYQKEIYGEICLDNFDSLLTKYLICQFKMVFFKKLKQYIIVSGYDNFIAIDDVKEIIDSIICLNSDLTIFNDIFVNENSYNVLFKAYQDSIFEVKENFAFELSKMIKTLNDYGYYSISFSLNDTYEHGLIQETLYEIIRNLPYLEKVTLIYKINKIMPEFLKEKIIKLIYENKNIGLNVVAINNKQEIAEYFSDGLKIYENINGLETSMGRMNVSNTSINLARLGLKYKTMNHAFYQELNELIEFVKNQLLFIGDIIANKTKKQYDTLFCGNLLDDERLDDDQKIRKVIRNGTFNINLIGLMECAYVIDKDNVLETVIKISKYIADKISHLAQDTKLNFTLSAINYLDDATYLIELDKTVFGLIDQITNKKSYENVLTYSEKGKIPLNDLQRLNRLFTGGSVLDVNMPKNVTLNKIKLFLDELLATNQLYVRVRRRN